MDMKDGVCGADDSEDDGDDGDIMGASGGDCRYDGDEADFLCRDRV